MVTAVIIGQTGGALSNNIPEFSFQLLPADSAVASNAETGERDIGVTAAEQKTLVQCARKELIDYLVISAYLYIWLGTLIFYKATILHSEGLESRGT